MARDSDLAALLPEPPPPRPAQRERALEMALRRFDGGDDVPRPAARPADPARPRGWLARPQLASLASLAVVAVLSGTVWLTQRDSFVAEHPEIVNPRPRQASQAEEVQTVQAARAPVLAPAGPEAAEEAADRLATAPSEQTDTRAPAASQPAPIQVDETLLEQGAKAEIESQLNRLPQFGPPPPAAAARAQPSAPVPPNPQNITVTGSRIARQDYEANSPTVTVDEVKAEADDWTACTLLDPSRNLQRCRAIADPAAPGARGRAAAQLADGLSRAWNGELDKAIQAFDRAIAATPDLAIAYLNRGLAYRQKGDPRRARPDLDRAAQLNPGYRAALP